MRFSYVPKFSFIFHQLYQFVVVILRRDAYVFLEQYLNEQINVKQILGPKILFKQNPSSYLVTIIKNIIAFLQKKWQTYHLMLLL
mgnify:FL=1